VQSGLVAIGGRLISSGAYFGDGCVVDARRDHDGQ